MSRIRIAIADDQVSFREGLNVTLSGNPDFQIVIEAENGRELLNAMQATLPDVIFMDLKMPVMDGMEATRLVRAQYPSVKVLVVTMFNDEQFILRAIKMGANGYILKNASPEEIIRSVYAVRANDYYFFDGIGNDVLKKMVVELQVQPRFNTNSNLTEQELLLLDEAAGKDSITAFNEEEKIFANKIGVFNRAGLIMFHAAARR